MPPVHLPRRTKVLYGIGSVAYGVKDNGFQFFLLLYYNQVLGLPEAWVGLGIMVALLVDALIDPIVGYVSDHWRSRWGRRHPFMYAAALPVAGAYWLLWSPPAGLSHPQLFAYFITIAVLVRVFITFYEIPSASLVPELTDQYDERTSILAFRFFFGWWGGLTMAVAAYAIFLQPDATHPVGVLNPAGYHHYGVAASITMLLAILISAVGTHRYIPWLRRPPERRTRGVASAFRQLVETLSNRSFVALFVAGVFAAMGVGISSALTLYVNTYFWELTSAQMSLLTLPLFLSALLAVALAPPLSMRLGKKRAAITVSVSALVLSPAPIALRLIGMFPANGTPALLPTVIAFAVVSATLFITSSILTASMVADLAEDSEVATGRRSEGVFVAANMFVQKAVSGIGIFASSLLLGLVDFPRDAKPGQVDPDVVWRLGFVYVTLLVAVYACAIACLSLYRISREQHEENLRRLASTTRS
ncbi:MAG TPA: MFS transporter [Candidatus Limnocylindria bacterium]|nr:MFS transporter [Candidatus Limnocylindria bacterium]